MQVIIRDSKYGMLQYDLSEMGKSVITFGRSPECDIQLKTPFVSRSHGVIYYENGHWVIQDMQSTYGVYTKERKITQNLLQNGSVIFLYSEKADPENCVEMQFWGEEAPAAKEAEAAVAAAQGAAAVAASASGSASVPGASAASAASAQPSAQPGSEASGSPKAPVIPPDLEPEKTSFMDWNFGLITIILAGVGFLSLILISKFGPWLPIAMAVLTIASGILAFKNKTAGKKGIIGLSVAGVALILSVIVTIHNGSAGSFWWAKEGRGLPLYSVCSSIFDPAAAAKYDFADDMPEKDPDYLEQLLP